MRIRCSFVAVFSSLACALHAQVWTQLPGAVSALARYNHASAYDLARARLVVFGGQSSGAAILGDTLEHDGTQWTAIATPVAPTPRWAHGMAYDIGRSRVVLFGGQNTAGVVVSDTWEWDGTAWQQMQTAVAPTPRMGMAMAADLFGGGVLVHGGRTNVAFLFGDLWRWTGNQWLLQDNTGPLRCAHSMAIDPHNGALVLFGGWNTVSFGDTWIWSNGWQLTNIAGPTARWGHRMASDLLRHRVVLSGGLGGADETWAFDGLMWFRLGDGPPRYNHTLDYDLASGRCFAVSGYPVGTFDVWSFGGAAPGTIQPFGQGCGTSPIPTLAALTAPRLGMTLQLSAASARGATVYLAGFSSTNWNSLPLPVDLVVLGAPGCLVHVAPDLMDVALPVAGSSTHAYAVPNDATLVGVQFFAQALVADPSSNPAGISVTNALAGTIGP